MLMSGCLWYLISILECTEMSVYKYISHNWRSDVYGVVSKVYLQSIIKCGWHRNAISLPWNTLKIIIHFVLTFICSSIYYNHDLEKTEVLVQFMKIMWFFPIFVNEYLDN